MLKVLLPITAIALLTGCIIVVGEVGRNNIDVSAEIRYADPDDIRLSLERQGTEARLIADMRNDSRHGGWAHINVVVRMPADLDLDLEDGSGAITISGLRSSLLVNDGSGSLQIDGGAALTLKDGSGAISVRGAGGLNILESGSGGVEIKDVRGPVDL